MNNLKQIRTIKGISQNELAKSIGMSRSTIAMWETGGSQPDNDMLAKLSRFFNVTIDFLLDVQHDFDIPTPSGRGVLIPVLGRVQAGVPADAVEDILGYEEITKELSASGEFFALAIKGDSMEPKISEGDIVIVRKQSSVENGDIAVVLVNGAEATVKRIKKEPTGLMLIPSNPTFEPMFYNNDDVSNIPVEIIGKVIELRAKF